MISRTKEIYRESCRRSHRVLGSYLVLWAWRKGVDCVVVDRSELFWYLGIKAMRKERLQWLDQDIKDLFPYVENLSGRTGGHYSTYLSRRKFPRGVFDAYMRDDDRVGALGKHGLRAASIDLPTERKMIGQLAAVAAGLKQRKRRA